MPKRRKKINRFLKLKKQNNNKIQKKIYRLRMKLTNFKKKEYLINKECSTNLLFINYKERFYQMSSVKAMIRNN